MKRSKEKITYLILELCKTPVSKTRIVYLCNLNFKTVRPYVERLAAAGLLEASDNPTSAYRTTTKGLEALEHINALKNMIGDLY